MDAFLVFHHHVNQIQFDVRCNHQPLLQCSCRRQEPLHTANRHLLLLDTHRAEHRCSSSIQQHFAHRLRVHRLLSRLQLLASQSLLHIHIFLDLLQSHLVQLLGYNHVNQDARYLDCSQSMLAQCRTSRHLLVHRMMTTICRVLLRVSGNRYGFLCLPELFPMHHKWRH